jgi:hypothetical protein
VAWMAVGAAHRCCERRSLTAGTYGRPHFRARSVLVARLGQVR